MGNYYEDMQEKHGAAEQGAPLYRRRKRLLPVWIALMAAALVLCVWGAALAVGSSMREYIDVISVEGTIAASPPTGLFETTEGYHHDNTLSAIDRLIEDNANRAILLRIDSPGGSVYETDELYLKLMEYKEKTQRPIYASFGNYAASGGYYAAMASDYIVSNRNCVTGSIGVRLGPIMDVSALLKKLGVEPETITSGRNKAMGDGYSPLTEEQRAIYQAYIDESYQQFAEIVAQGRDMPLPTVIELADGRIYTARQALDNGLIDQIGSEDDAIDALKADFGLEDCEVRRDVPRQPGLSSVFSALESLRPKTEAESAAELLAEWRSHNGYYCEVPIG